MTFPPPSAGVVVVLPDAPPTWAREARRAGWTIVSGEALTSSPWLLEATIVRTSDPAVAGEALARSGGIAVVGAHIDVAVIVDDARRVGATVWAPHVSGLRARDAGADETDALLAELAQGRSMAEAAAATHVSLRTAQRRIGAARAAYGVTTTPGAVAAWRAGHDRRGGGRHADEH